MRKIYLLSCIIGSIQLSIFAGNGTQIDPYTVTQAITKTDGSAQTHWVKGYIVGEMSDFSNNKYFYELAPPFAGTTSYLIADNPNEINLTKCMPIQLGIARSDSFNLDTNPQYWRKEILTCGLLRDYFAMPGLKTLSSVEITTPTPLVDESIIWNFFEDMDGDYTPLSSTSIFAGGTYSGSTGNWEIYGGTWGDSSNDKKWGKASARIRLSEASTGNPGYIQMKFNKANGVGVVRFWAGYYDTDNGGALAIQTSRNEGQTWETAIASQLIAKDWKEYQFTINQAGNVRIRIMKAETGSSGINVDKIRISDYLETSGIESNKENNISYSSNLNSLRIIFNNPDDKATLFNISGYQVWNKMSSTNQSLLNLEKGIYILKVNNRSYKIIHR